MSQEYMENFWNKCEDQLKHYTTLLNNDMVSKGFKVENKILDKMHIGVYYILIMNYHENTEHRVDVLLLSMHVP